MQQKLLVKESEFINFLKSFFSAKEKGSNAESDWLKGLRKQNPKLANIWQKADIAHLDTLLTIRQSMNTTKGKSDIDKIIIDRGYAKNGQEVEELIKIRKIKI